jgi:hypothetical protein
MRTAEEAGSAVRQDGLAGFARRRGLWSRRGRVGRAMRVTIAG